MHADPASCSPAVPKCISKAPSMFMMALLTALLVTLFLPRSAWAQSTQEDPQKLWQRQSTAGHEAFRAGRYVEAEAHFQKAVLTARKGNLAGPYINSRSALGDALIGQNRFDEAEDAYRSTLKLLQRHMPTQRGAIAQMRGKLADAQVNRGNYKDAELLYIKSLAFYSRPKGGKPAEAAELMRRLGKTYLALAHFGKAVSILRNSLDIKSRLDGPESPQAAQVRMSLAIALKTMDRLDEAEKEISRVLPVMKKMSGGGLHFAQALRIQGDIRLAQGRNVEAIARYERSLAILEKELEPTSLSLVSNFNNLALAYQKTGALEKSLAFFERSLIILKGTLGVDHPRVAMAENNMAYSLIQMKRYQDTEPRLLRAKRILEGTVGKQDLLYAAVLDSLAVLYREQGLYGKAEPLFKESLRIVESAVGPNHSSLIENLGNYAELLKKTNRPEEAKILEDRAAAIRKKIEAR